MEIRNMKTLSNLATHFSILAWRIPWMEEPGKLQSTGSQRVGHDWAISQANSSVIQLWNLLYISQRISFFVLPSIPLGPVKYLELKDHIINFSKNFQLPVIWSKKSKCPILISWTYSMLFEITFLIIFFHMLHAEIRHQIKWNWSRWVVSNSLQSLGL